MGCSGIERNVGHVGKWVGAGRAAASLGVGEILGQYGGGGGGFAGYMRVTGGFHSAMVALLRVLLVSNSPGPAAVQQGYIGDGASGFKVVARVFRDPREVSPCYHCRCWQIEY